MYKMVTTRKDTGEEVETETFQTFEELREDLASTANFDYAYDVLRAFETGATTITMLNGRFYADTYTLV